MIRCDRLQLYNLTPLHIYIYIEAYKIVWLQGRKKIAEAGADQKKQIEDFKNDGNEGIRRMNQPQKYECNRWIDQPHMNN